MMMVSKRSFLVLAALIFAIFAQNAHCKPFLSGLFETGPTTPESHISDYHNQPKASLRHQEQQQQQEPQITATDNNNKNSENEQQQRGGNTIYPEIIGNIFNSVRARVTNVVGNLLSSRSVMANRMDQPTSQEIKQSNKKVSPLSGMDAGMNYERQNKLNLAKLASNGTQDKVGEAIKEQIKDGEVDNAATKTNHSEIPLKNDEKLMENATLPVRIRGFLHNNGTKEIIDAFFDLDSDDIFYDVELESSNQKIVQRPRLFPLILSSLVKYRNQSDMGFLQNATRKERNRIRALYMLRPLIGVLRRKAENSRVRQNLREMERIMTQMMQLEQSMMIARRENNGTQFVMAQQQLTQQQELMRQRAKLAFSTGFDKHFMRRQAKTRQLTTKTTHIQSLRYLLQRQNGKFDENNNTIIEPDEDDEQDNSLVDQENDENDDDDEQSDTNDEDENNSSSDESDEGKSNLAFGETFGILILELIGTVAGLTWGAFSQLSQYVQGSMGGN